MSKHAFAIVLVLTAVACSGSDLAEKESIESLVTRDPDIATVTGQTSAEPGVPEVVLETNPDGGATPPDGGPSRVPDGGETSCGASISCSNGACTCGAGPNKGRSCVGSSSAGAASCATLCYFCK